MNEEVIIVDPTTGGAKGQKAERYDLLPFEALDEVAKVYAAGAKKYTAHNWRKGYSWALSLGAMLRHISLFAQGYDYDVGEGGTGCMHLACAVFHGLALITFFRNGLGTDDRAAKGNK